VRELGPLELVNPPEVRVRGLQVVERGPNYVLLRLMLGQVALKGLVPREQAALGARWVLGVRLMHQRVARMGREEMYLGEGSEMGLVFRVYDRRALIAHR
jgi:hypothetical protein